MTAKKPTKKRARVAALPGESSARPLRLEYRRAGDLTPHPLNWLVHPPAQVDAVRESIADVGWADALLLNETTGRVLDGHLRRGLDPDEEVPVLVGRWTEEEEKRILATLDPMTGMATMDPDRFRELAAGINAGSVVSDMLAGLDGEAKRMIAVRAHERALAAGEDEVPPVPDDPITEPGDLWTLGEHRVLCGDATDATDVARLCNGWKATCVVTDPPYGMSYKGQVFGKDGMANDEDSEFESTLRGAINEAPVLNAIWSICFGTSRLDAFFRATSSLKFHRLLTIYKPNGVAKPWRAWILTSEVVGLFSTGEPGWPEPIDHCHDVYTFDYSERPDRSVDHPTVKPLSIIVDVMQKIGTGDVYDPFLGSGTTLIAAEQLGRRCYGLEIEPAYCDVIVKRWENLTGKKAERTAK